MTTETKTADGSMVVPAGVTQLDSAKLTGPGGGGAGNVSGRTGGGGGGGAVAKGTAITVVPGETLTWVIPVGGAPGVAAVNGTAGADATLTGSVSGLLLRAKGGSGGLTGNPGVNGAGGLASGCVGPTTISGGTGGTLSTGGAGADGGGAGGTGGKPGTPGTAPGGGGGGKLGTFGGDGGAGARAELVIEYAGTPTIAPADSFHGVTTDSPVLDQIGPPPWSGTGRANVYNSDLNVYNAKADNTARIRAALKAAQAGTGRAVIAVFGDSAAVPFNGGSINDETGFPRRTVQELASELGTVESGHGAAPALWAGATTYKNEYWTFGGSFSLLSNLAGEARLNLNATATLNPPQGCTDIEIYVTADSADFTYSVDGGAAQPVTTGAGTALEKVTISGLTEAAHTVVVTATTGSMWLAGATMYTDGPGILLFNVAYGGSRAAHGTAVQSWTDDTSPMPSLYGVRKGMADLFGLDPDLCVWMIGGNDIFQGDTVFNAIDGLEEMIGWYPAADHVMTGAWEISGTNMTNWDAYWAAKYQLADDLDILLVDWRDGVAATNAIADSLGYTGADGEHPSDAALAIMGSNLTEILLIPTLEPAAAAHQATADPTTLTQTHVLAPADSSHIHGTEQPSVTGESDLAPLTARLTHVAESPALAQIHALAPADADLSHSASSPALVVGFTPDDASLGHSADSPDLDQTHVLPTASSDQAHATDSPAVTQVHGLAPAGAQHGHTATETALAQVHVLAPDDAAHGHGSSSPTLGQVHELEPAPALLEHTAESPVLAQLHTIEPVDSDHVHGSGSPSITGEGTIAPALARLTHSTESPTLDQVHVLAPASSSHAHAAGEPTIAEPIPLAPESSAHGHVTAAPTLSQLHVLTPGRAVHQHVSEGPLSFLQTHVLTADDALLEHSTDLVTLTQDHALAVLDALLTHDTSSPLIVVLGGRPPQERRLLVPKDVRKWTVPEDRREWRVFRDRSIESAP